MAGNFLLDLLFPPKCVFCRKLLKAGETDICEHCRISLPRNPNPERKSGPGEFFSLCVAPLKYTGVARSALLRYKFRDYSGYAGCFGRLLADCIAENLTGRYNLLSWVPLSDRRKRKRGYDQSFLLAMAASSHLGELPIETLIKQTDSLPQSSISGAAERRANIMGAYRAADPSLIQGKRILLIDDIITTGSTLSECARVLLMAGAEDVCCAVLAKTE